NNGSGGIRVTLYSTSSLQTGQQGHVGGQTGQAAASGNWTITVVDGTQMDLETSTFNTGGPWISGRFLSGATKHRAQGNLTNLFNLVTFDSFTLNHQTISVSGTFTQSNPIPTITALSSPLAGSKIVLPNVTDPNSPSIGAELVFKHTGGAGTSAAVDIMAN